MRHAQNGAFEQAYSQFATLGDYADSAQKAYTWA